MVGPRNRNVEKTYAVCTFVARSGPQMLVDNKTENLRVGSSILPLPTRKKHRLLKGFLPLGEHRRIVAQAV